MPVQTCKKCLKSLPSSAKFCGYCGHSLATIIGPPRLSLWAILLSVGGAAFVIRGFLDHGMAASPLQRPPEWFGWGFKHFLLGALLYAAVLIRRKGAFSTEMISKENATTAAGWALAGFFVGATRVTWYPVALGDVILSPLRPIGAPLAWGMTAAVIAFTVIQLRATAQGKQSRRWRAVPVTALIALMLVQGAQRGAFPAAANTISQMREAIEKLVWLRKRPPPQPSNNEAAAREMWQQAAARLREVEESLEDWVRHPARTSQEHAWRTRWLTNKCNEALTLCDRSLGLWKGSVKPYLYRVRALRYPGRFREAMDGCRNALERFPGDSDLVSERELLEEKLRSGQSLGADTATQLAPDAGPAQLPKDGVSEAISAARKLGTPTTQAVQDATSGLQYIDVKVGEGAPAKAGLLVTVHYTGWLVSGKKFDSSSERGQPFTFPLGSGRVIKGWDEGLVGMKIGGVRKLIVPSGLGYGTRGAGDVIPSNATLIFEIHLLDVKEHGYE